LIRGVKKFTDWIFQAGQPFCAVTAAVEMVSLEKCPWDE